MFANSLFLVNLELCSICITLRPGGFLQTKMKDDCVHVHEMAVEFKEKLKDAGRKENERLKDLGAAIDWVTEQLVRP